jgi:hypothetical protein
MHVSESKWLAHTVTLAFASLSLAIAACSSSGSTGECACPAGEFLISVPADRASDVKSVIASGACEFADSAGNGQYSAASASVGTCHIAVTFKSGAPEYDTDVSIVRGPPSCGCLQGPTTAVVVPDVDGGGAGGEGGGEGSIE